MHTIITQLRSNFIHHWLKIDLTMIYAYKINLTFHLIRYKTKPSMNYLNRILWVLKIFSRSTRLIIIQKNLVILITGWFSQSIKLMISLTGITLINNTIEQIIKDLLLLISFLVIGSKLIALISSYTLLDQIPYKIIIKQSIINPFLKVISKFIIMKQLYNHQLIALR